MVIVLYFSRKGENLVDGKIVSLAQGNTAVIAGKIAEVLNCPLLEVRSIQDYPADYFQAVARAEAEKSQNSRPAFQAAASALEQAEAIFLGYPNWHGTLPMILHHYLEKCELADKTIYPFCTHEGSGFGSSLLDLKKICPLTIIKPGLPVRGSTVQQADPAIKNWLRQYQRGGEQQWQSMKKSKMA